MRTFLILASLVTAASLAAQGAPPNSETSAKALAKLGKQRDQAQAALAKNPKSGALKTKFVKLNDKLAYDTMYANGKDPHYRYSSALKLYRQTLKVSPTDPEANNWVHTIERIYKSMHRPIPK